MNEVRSVRAIITSLTLMQGDVQKALLPDDDSTLVGMAKRMKDIQELKDTIDVIWKETEQRYDELRLRLIPDAMAEQEIRTLTVDGVGRVGLTGDLYASIINTEDGSGKEKAYNWLKENGYSGLVQEYVQPSTLKATIKEGLKQGEYFPEELFKVQPFTRAAITKVKS